MSSASFAITYDELRVIVATQQGYSRVPTEWNDNQKYVINDVVTSGIAQVYFPPPVNGEKVAPDWTFLKPESVIYLVEGSDTLRLPDDFGSFVGPLTVLGSQSRWLIQWINEGKIRQMQQGDPERTGFPQYACEVPLREMTEPQGQRKALIVFPTPDQDYTLQCVYSINPDRITGATPFCYGGPQYRELYIESCLAIAEQRFDDTLDGPHTAKFNMMLMGAVTADNKNRPQKLGYNGNIERGRRNYRLHTGQGELLYNGQPFE
jgi:hypothetical protein